MPEDRESQDDALVAVSKAINELIINKNFSEALDQSLKYIGKAFNGDAFILEVGLNKDKEFVLDMKHYYMQVFDQTRLQLNRERSLSAFPEVSNMLKQGKSYTFKKSTAKPEMVSSLNKTGGKAGIIVPIFMKQNFWGVLSLNTIEEEREWGRATVAVMETLAKSIGVSLEKLNYGESLSEEIVAQSRVIVENNRRFESLVYNVPGIVFRCRFDKHWTMDFISDYVFELTGHRSDQFLPPKSEVTFDSLIHPNDREFVWMEVQRQLKKSSFYKVNYRITDAEDRVKWFWEQGVKQENEHGEEMLEGCIIDISDRVENHEKVVAATMETEDRARSYFSRELHDNLQQLLTTAHLNLEHAKKRSDEGAMKFLNNASGSLKEAIQHTRDLSHKLMPKTIEDYGYVAAVEALLDSLPSESDPHFQLQHNMQEGELPKTMALSLYRITQEAINNILKHAEAKQVMIQLMRHPDQLLLSIEDDGKGFDYKEVLDAESGFGLNSMISRATSIGAQLFVESAPGKGTQLFIEIPYQTDKENEAVESENIAR
ncbi:ATP-binding protein [Reichenbachiella ulvae]|uniref:histidine kinase n=1 Tax=Reichenbachiella ulvae TaxID=2980104 RepID=A0ABT3CPU8_9BACT|nr:ATP-binding protein [Reichenbachiella ulvae]MCV9385549.1 PAS domain-containing protein [Reichenbachiella ulvae]